MEESLSYLLVARSLNSSKIIFLNRLNKRVSLNWQRFEKSKNHKRVEGDVYLTNETTVVIKGGTYGTFNLNYIKKLKYCFRVCPNEKDILCL